MWRRKEREKTRHQQGRKTRGKGERIRGPERRVREVREEKVLLT